LIFGYTQEEKDGFKRLQWYSDKLTGYFKQQATQPQTLGYSLADSPVGLLSWIYEKLYHASDAYPFEDDESWYSNIYISFDDA